VGASGDLTPLSYVAAALVGERDVRFRDELCDARSVWAKLGHAPLTLAPKEGLALMNGTAVMTGLACLAFARAGHLTRLAARLTALSTVALDGRAAHFDPMLFEVKPHAGQAEAAAWIREDLAGREDTPGHRLQDRYSIRCAPHVIGVARDALTWVRERAEQRQRQSADRSRWRTRSAWRQLLRRPYCVRDGCAESGGRESCRPDGSPTGAARRR
jgi:histidine ammonia-lyase